MSIKIFKWTRNYIDLLQQNIKICFDKMLQNSNKILITIVNLKNIQY